MDTGHTDADCGIYTTEDARIVESCLERISEYILALKNASNGVRFPFRDCSQQGVDSKRFPASNGLPNGIG